MRKRICMSLVSAKPDTNTIFFKESKESIERNIRRAKFMQLKTKLSVVKKITPELIEFSNGVENAINQFKRSKKAS